MSYFAEVVLRDLRRAQDFSAIQLYYKKKLKNKKCMLSGGTSLFLKERSLTFILAAKFFHAFSG